MENPIIDNRLVNDKTFAIRFTNFLNGIQVADAWGDEELKYMKYVADKLLQYQLATVESDEEKDYLRLNKLVV